MQPLEQQQIASTAGILERLSSMSFARFAYLELETSAKVFRPRLSCLGTTGLNQQPINLDKDIK